MTVRELIAVLQAIPDSMQDMPALRDGGGLGPMPIRGEVKPGSFYAFVVDGEAQPKPVEGLVIR